MDYKKQYQKPELTEHQSLQDLTAQVAPSNIH